MATSTVRTRIYGKSKRIMVAGSWVTNGAGAFDQTLVRGEGFTVLRTAVGQAEVTFDEIYGRLESFVAMNTNMAQNADRAISGGAETAPVSPTKGKIVVQCYQPSTGGSSEFGAADRVNFIAILKMGSV